MHRHILAALLISGFLASLGSAAAPGGDETSAGKTAAGVPAGAAALGYTRIMFVSGVRAYVPPSCPLPGR